MIFFSVALANFIGDVNFASGIPVEVRIRNEDGSSGALALIFEDGEGERNISQLGATTNGYGVIEFWCDSESLNVVESSSRRTVNASGGGLSVRIKSGCVLDEAPNDGNTYLRGGGIWVKYP